jgi:hypothetical protein
MALAADDETQKKGPSSFEQSFRVTRPAVECALESKVAKLQEQLALSELEKQELA